MELTLKKTQPPRNFSILWITLSVMIIVRECFHPCEIVNIFSNVVKYCCVGVLTNAYDIQHSYNTYTRWWVSDECIDMNHLNDSSVAAVLASSLLFSFINCISLLSKDGNQSGIDAMTYICDDTWIRPGLCNDTGTKGRGSHVIMRRFERKIIAKLFDWGKSSCNHVLIHSNHWVFGNSSLTLVKPLNLGHVYLKVVPERTWDIGYSICSSGLKMKIKYVYNKKKIKIYSAGYISIKYVYQVL